MESKKFNLFENCKIVEGKMMATLLDLQNNQLYVIPKKLSSLLLHMNGLDGLQINILKKEHQDVEKLIEFLLDKNLGVWIDTSITLPNLSTEYEYPFKISNSIVEVDNLSNKHTLDIVKKLEGINCKYLELRVLGFYTLETIENLLGYLQNSKSIISEIYLYLNESAYLKLEDIENLKVAYPRLSDIKFFKNSNNKNDVRKNCGNVCTGGFICNMKFFTESVSNNSCLNKKISIDVNGDIKNCPSMSDSYGNIKNTTLEEAINRPGFKKYWNVTKDQIDICKDCEFRYVCTDCRAYTERTTFDKEIDLSKPLKCGYNPYTNEWAEWSTNPIKEKAITYYGMPELG